MPQSSITERYKKDRFKRLVGLEDDVSVVGKKICSHHFNQSDFLNRSDGRLELKNDVFPSLNLPNIQDLA